MPNYRGDLTTGAKHNEDTNRKETDTAVTDHVHQKSKDTISKEEAAGNSLQGTPGTEEARDIVSDESESEEDMTDSASEMEGSGAQHVRTLLLILSRWC